MLNHPEGSRGKPFAVDSQSSPDFRLKGESAISMPAGEEYAMLIDFDLSQVVSRQ